jgi:hypothetical protein
MPVIRIDEVLPAQFHNQLVARLAIELNARSEAHARGEPLVVENPIRPTDRFFAVVVWSDWEDVPWGARTNLILDAYRKADLERTDAAPRAPFLATANGLTWDEADETGFFKYGVFPYQTAPNDAVTRAMIDAGAYATRDGPRLRFLDRASSRKALEQLQTQLPSVKWVEQRIVRSED